MPDRSWQIDPTAHFDIEDNMLNALQTEYWAVTKFGEVTRRVVDAAAVAAKARADREASNADMMFDAVCARLAHLVENGVATQTRAGVLECVADLTRVHEQFTDERARHLRCGQHMVGSWQPARQVREKGLLPPQ